MNHWSVSEEDMICTTGGNRFLVDRAMAVLVLQVPPAAAWFPDLTFQAFLIINMAQNRGISR
jgi:hypothetical protein